MCTVWIVNKQDLKHAEASCRSWSMTKMKSPRHEKTCLCHMRTTKAHITWAAPRETCFWGLWPGQIQTSLRSYGSKLEVCNFIHRSMFSHGLTHFFFWKSGYPRVRIEVRRNSRNLWISVKNTFFTQKIENLIFLLKCSSLIPKLYSENWFQIRAVVNALHAFKIIVYGFIWAVSWENLFVPYANNKGTDQPGHSRSLMSALLFAVWIG